MAGKDVDGRTMEDRARGRRNGYDTLDTSIGMAYWHNEPPSTHIFGE